MSLKEDMDTLEYYSKRGLGQEYLRGKLTPEQMEQRAEDAAQWPADDTRFKTGYARIIARGE